MKNVVVRNIKRADKNAIATFEKLGASTTHEALGRYQLMKPYMRPVWAGASIAGPAVTILAQPGDNWMLHVAIEQCQPGDIVVLGCTTDNTDGMIGTDGLFRFKPGGGTERPLAISQISSNATTVIQPVKQNF